MKNLLSFLLLLAIAAPAYALTKVKGYITTNTTWTKANSPYVLTGGLLVQHGVTLTIEPGTEVQSTPSYNFWVEGKLVAIGTPTDSIILTSQSYNGPNGWRGINFRSTYGASEGQFQYCSIRNSIYAISTDTATTLTVKNCYFRAHDVAIYVSSGNFEVTDNSFEYCTALLDDYIPGFPATGTFKNNELRYAKWGVDLRRPSSEISVINNAFYECPYGIMLSQVKKISVKDNKILKCGVGILAYLTQLQDDDLQGNMIGYCEEGLRVISANGNFIHNSFRSNNKALVVNETSPGFIFEYNCIDSSTEYNVVLNSANDINLKNNWWGTTDSTKMHATSYDYDQNSTSGYISFGPYLTNQPTGCKAVPDTNTPFPTYLPEMQYTPAVSIYPNPVTSSFTVQASNTATIKNIEVYNMVGTLIMSNAVSAQQADVDMSAYAPGIYLYKISTANGQLHTGRLLKQ